MTFSCHFPPHPLIFPSYLSSTQRSTFRITEKKNKMIPLFQISMWKNNRLRLPSLPTHLVPFFQSLGGASSSVYSLQPPRAQYRALEYDSEAQFQLHKYLMEERNGRKAEGRKGGSKGEGEKKTRISGSGQPSISSSPHRAAMQPLRALNLPISITCFSEIITAPNQDNETNCSLRNLKMKSCEWVGEGY